MTDPNSWTWSTYWNILGDQIIYIYIYLKCYFLDGYKVSWSKDFWITQYKWFYTHLKESKKIEKKINFDLQRYFHMKIMFYSLDFRCEA
jgi:hypothetical protein